MRRVVLVLSWAVLVVGARPGLAQEVLQGLDFWETKSGQTHVDLSDLQPVCNFIIQGDTQVPLRGIPLDSSPHCPGQNLGNSNTIIRRLASTFGLDVNGEADVPIQIVGLHLESVQQFKVIYLGNPEDWRVDVSLAEVGPQPQGQMTIRKTHPNGGTFDSSLPVRPHFIFTRVDACPAVVRCETDGPIIVLDGLGAPWSYSADPNSPVLELPGCTSNFFPGVIPFAPGEITIQTGGPPNPGACHAVPGSHQHCVTPPPPPKLFQHDWQMAVHFEFCFQNISNKVFVNDFHIRRARYVPMSIPAGAPDSSIYIKSVSVCDTAKVCSKAPPDRWARVNWDSTDVNFRREAWWVFPPVPPGGMAPEMDIVFSLPCYAQPSAGAWFEVDYECTDQCAVVDSGTFRFHCPPVVKCPDSTGCKQTVGVIDLSEEKKGGVIDILESYPNPAGISSSTVRFRLATESNTVLRVFDAQGRLIRTLVNERRVAGNHEVKRDGRNDAGAPVRAGAYFYQLETNGKRQAKKVMILK